MAGVVRLLQTNNARVIGRHGNVPPFAGSTDKIAFPLAALIVILAALLVPASLLTSPAAMTATCAMLLIGGLPHGALDLAVLRREADQRTALVVTLYLGLAAVMFATWQVAPTLALALFLAMAIAHFAEDWSDAEHPFFAVGIAVALISAPALMHHQALAELFIMLAGEPGAAGLADTLLLVAPVAAACALLAMLLLWNAGSRASACNAGCALLAMILLPPITGFAIYFCLIHSPSHFRAGLRRLAPSNGVAKPTIVATLGGMAIAVVAFVFLPTAAPSSRLFAASFMTLSILTLPHMAVPLILRRLGFSARR